MKGLAKLAADSTVVEDLMAGIDPTGVNTFQNSLKNEDNHLKHQLIGDAGGFAGGALIGTLSPAALMGGAALATKKFNPSLAGEFSTMAKGTLDALNPATMGRYVQSLGGLTKFKNQGSNFLDETKQVADMVEKAEKGNSLSRAEMLEGLNIAKNMKGKQKELNTTEKMLSDKYYKGKPVGEGGARAFTALSTAGAGALSGGMGAMGAHMQYNTGQRTKKMQEEQEQKNNLGKIEAPKVANDVVIGLAKLASTT